MGVWTVGITSARTSIQQSVSGTCCCLKIYFQKLNAQPENDLYPPHGEVIFIRWACLFVLYGTYTACALSHTTKVDMLAYTCRSSQWDAWFLCRNTTNIGIVYLHSELRTSKIYGNNEAKSFLQKYCSMNSGVPCFLSYHTHRGSPGQCSVISKK